MTSRLLKAFEPALIELDWIDKFGGLARPISVNYPVEGRSIKKTFPVSCEMSSEECFTQGGHEALTPDSKRKSVVYWSIVNDTTLASLTVNGGIIDGAQKFTTQVMLTAWLNLPKLGKENCFSSSAPVKQLLKILTTNYPCPKDILSMAFQPTNILENVSKIFQGFSYEDKQGLMTYPYYCFAIQGSLIWAESYGCFDEEWTEEPKCL